MAVASYLKFHPNLSKHGGGANSEMQSGLASAASAKQEESQRQRQRLVKSILIPPRIIYIIPSFTEKIVLAMFQRWQST